MTICSTVYQSIEIGDLVQPDILVSLTSAYTLALLCTILCTKAPSLFFLTTMLHAKAPFFLKREGHYKKR